MEASQKVMCLNYSWLSAAGVLMRKERGDCCGRFEGGGRPGVEVRPERVVYSAAGIMGEDGYGCCGKVLGAGNDRERGRNYPAK